MRPIGWLFLGLLVIGWVAAVVPGPGSPEGAACDDGWRRARDGWQRADWLPDEPPVRRPALHPAVVGLLELLVSAMALVALAPVARRG